MLKINRLFFAATMLLSTVVACKTSGFIKKINIVDGGNFKKNAVAMDIFGLSKNILKEDSHFIYIVNYINHLPMVNASDFDALIYVYDRKQIYYFRNINQKKMHIVKTGPKKDYHEINSILSYYLKSGSAELSRMENADLSNGGLWTSFLYDIDLNNEIVVKKQFESLTFDSLGNAITFRSYMEQL